MQNIEIWRNSTRRHTGICRWVPGHSLDLPAFGALVRSHRSTAGNDLRSDLQHQASTTIARAALWCSPKVLSLPSSKTSESHFADEMSIIAIGYERDGIIRRDFHRVRRSTSTRS